jgi:hypothetical protein
MWGAESRAKRNEVPAVPAEEITDVPNVPAEDAIDVPKPAYMPVVERADSEDIVDCQP